MAVPVKWFPTLIKRTKSKSAETSVEWHAGLTPLAVFLAEGFSNDDAESVMVIVNDEQSELEYHLKPDDRLEFLVSIQGGSSVHHRQLGVD